MEVAVAGLMEEVKEGVKVVVVTARGGMGSAADLVAAAAAKTAPAVDAAEVEVEPAAAAVLAVEAVRVRVAEATPPGRSSGTL